MRPLAKSIKEYAIENKTEYLLEEYSPDNPLPPDEVGHNSTVPVTWVCSYDHKETEPPFKRLRRGYCSVCGKKRHGSFAQNYPDLLKYWSKDNTVDPYKIPPTYSKPVLWECEHGHTWLRKIPLQIKIGSCPYCSADERRFFTLHPEMLEQWHYDRNDGIDPNEVMAFSNQKFYWLCENGHSYTATPEKLMRRKVRCPVCSSFGFTRPDILEEWHPTKNGDKTPYDYAANSQHIAWFVCSVCGEEYTAKIANRADRITPNCPNCRGSK